MSNPADDQWWREAVVYQCYIRSFADGNADGTGDIAGLRNRIPYLVDLGVDAVWINPWYPSPQHDAGYDVADYRDIEPTYGTLAEADALLAAYFDRAPDEGLRRALGATGCASLLREALWAMVSALHLSAPGVDYGAYARDTLERLDASLDQFQTRHGRLP